MMRKLLRVAYVLPTMNIGGTELQLLHLMRGLAQDFEVTLILTRQGGTLIGDVRRAGIYTRVLDSASGWDPRQGRRIYRALRQHTPHIVHSFQFGFDYWVNRAARRADVPLILSSRRQLATWKRARHLWLQRRANRHVDHVIANSRAVAEFAAQQEGLPAHQLSVIPNGINADDYLSETPVAVLRRRFDLPPHGFVVGMIANFSPVKDHALFLDMAARILAVRRDVHFFLIGSGPLVHAMGRRIMHAGHAEHFTRLATVNEIADCLHVMDVFVLTSQQEGFPNAIMEAMAAGRPVVAPPVGGIAELLRDGETGRLVAPRTAEALADAVQHLLDTPAERAALGRAAAAYVRAHLPLDAMVAAHRALYHRLLKERLNAGR